MPASTGEIQWTSERALQPNQKRLHKRELAVKDQRFETVYVDLPNWHTETTHLCAQQPVLWRHSSSTFFEHALMVFGVVKSINEDGRTNSEKNAEADGSER